MTSRVSGYINFFWRLQLKLAGLPICFQSFTSFIDCRGLIARAAAGKAGCSVGTILDSRNEGGQTPLHVAVMRGSLEMVKVILEYPEADIEALDKDGDPPMLFSLACGTTECLKALIGRGADVNVRLKEGLGPTIAHMCASYGEPECMQVSMPRCFGLPFSPSCCSTCIHFFVWTAGFTLCWGWCQCSWQWGKNHFAQGHWNNAHSVCNSHFREWRLQINGGPWWGWHDVSQV